MFLFTSFVSCLMCCSFFFTYFIFLKEYIIFLIRLYRISVMFLHFISFNNSISWILIKPLATSIILYGLFVLHIFKSSTLFVISSNFIASLDDFSFILFINSNLEFL